MRGGISVLSLENNNFSFFCYCLCRGPQVYRHSCLYRHKVHYNEKLLLPDNETGSHKSWTSCKIFALSYVKLLYKPCVYTYTIIVGKFMTKKQLKKALHLTSRKAKILAKQNNVLFDISGFSFQKDSDGNEYLILEVSDWQYYKVGHN